METIKKSHVMEETQKIIVLLMALVAVGYFGFTLGEVYGRTKERSAILKYHQDKPMSLLEEAVNYLYLTIRK
jgi:hypothetical protein